MEKNIQTFTTLKIIIDRQRGYLGLVNTILLLSIVGFKWWFIFIIPFWILWAFLDWKYVFPAEKAINFQQILDKLK